MAQYKGFKIVRNSVPPNYYDYYLVYSKERPSEKAFRSGSRHGYYLFSANSLEAAEDGIDYYLETEEIPGRNITAPEPAKVNLEARGRHDVRNDLVGMREDPVKYHRERLARLQGLEAPMVIIDHAKDQLRRAEKRQGR